MLLPIFWALGEYINKREGLRWYWNIEKLAERLSTICEIKDEQLLWRDHSHYVCIVCVVPVNALFHHTGGLEWCKEIAIVIGGQAIAFHLKSCQCGDVDVV